MNAPTLSLQEAQTIYGDSEAVERGYVTLNVIAIAKEMAAELQAEGHEARDGMCIFPNVHGITEKYEDRCSRKERRSLDTLGAYFMGSVVSW